MSESVSVGELSNLWRFPVKSMLGAPCGDATITELGLLGDRAYGLIESESGKVISAKNVKAYPDLFACRAAFDEPPRLGHEMPPVRISLPNGRTISSDSADCDVELSRFFGRDVSLARNAPVNFTIDEHHPDIDNDDLGPVAEAQLGSALFAKIGAPSPVPEGAFLDAFPLSVLTTATLDHLNTLQPRSQFDERRFRMNVIVHTQSAGFVENAWVNHSLEIGEHVRLRIAMPDPRCVMTTLAQSDLSRDIEVLRTLATHNRIQVGDFGALPCAGVYALVTSPGAIRIGDAVRLA